MTSKQFDNLWAIILGGSSGFGFATAEKLAGHGMNLAIVYRETAIVEKEIKGKFRKLESENGIKILSFNLSALDVEKRQSMIREISVNISGDKIKLLLHSIARGNLKPLINNENVQGELTVDDIQLTAYAMSNSLLDWTRDILRANLFHKDARVVGLTSEGAHKYWQGYAAVSIAKSSLESLIKYMAVEFAGFGIKTNLVQAGITRTPSMERIPASETLIELSSKRNPMGRMTKPEDVANMVYLLCTDEAYWVNGSVIHVDGGEHCC
ncbi:MAG TPA: SDR family oxidoreductase [Chitinophagaceae bacterium]